jgi:uncharacterized protein YndB with AHSA1/START domain
MTQEFAKHGSLKVGPGATEVRIARNFPRKVERVWQTLVEPDLLVQWLAPGTVEPHEGGRVTFNFADSGLVIDSTITEFNPPHAVAHSWSNPAESLRPLRFEIVSSGDGARLTLTLQLPAGEDAARFAAGFEAHLEMLAAALEGAPITFPFAMFKAMRAAYRTA